LFQTDIKEARMAKRATEKILEAKLIGNALEVRADE